MTPPKKRLTKLILLCVALALPLWALKLSTGEIVFSHEFEHEAGVILEISSSLQDVTRVKQTGVRGVYPEARTEHIYLIPPSQSPGPMFVYRLLTRFVWFYSSLAVVLLCLFWLWLPRDVSGTASGLESSSTAAPNHPYRTSPEDVGVAGSARRISYADRVWRRLMVTSLVFSLLLWGFKLFTVDYSDAGEHLSGTIGLILRPSPEFRIRNHVGSGEVGPPEQQTFLVYGNICDGYFGEKKFSWLANEGYACSTVLTVALFVIWLRNREEIENSPSVFGWLRVDHGRAQEASPPDDPGSSRRRD